MKHFQHATALVSPDACVGEDARIWAFVNIQAGVSIGRDCNICDCCFIEKNVVIGDRVVIKNGVSVYEGVVLEADVFVGPNVVFVNDRHPRSHNKNWCLEPTSIRQGASLGANCTVMCGVTVGRYSLVGAGSVVLRDVPAHALVVGNPARQAGWVDHDGQRLNERLLSPSGRQYRLVEDGLEWVEGGENA